MKNEEKGRRASDSILINRARRAIIKKGQLGACLVTGVDKIRSGFGNGDCLMLDFNHLVFAVCDATERYPSASNSFLSRFARRLADGGAPDSKQGWLDLINGVYARQNYHEKTTFSCVAVDKRQAPSRAFVIHGGDSVVLLVNLETKQVEYSSSADMYFAGRAKELLGVQELSLEHNDFGFIIASDGISDAARLSGRPLKEASGSALRRLPFHEMPERLAEYLDTLPGGTEYDDIGIIVFSPAELTSEAQPTVLIGGTTPVEETTFQKELSKNTVNDQWTPLSTCARDKDGSARPEEKGLIRI